MNIVHLIRSLHPDGGGPREFVLRSSELLRARGNAVTILTLDPSLAAWVRDCPGAFGIGGSRAGWGFSREAISVGRAACEGADALVVHGLWQYQTVLGARISRDTGCPMYVFPHGMLDPWFQRTFPLKALKKRIYWSVLEHAALLRARALCFTCAEERRLGSGEFKPWRLTDREHVVGFGTIGPDRAVSLDGFDPGENRVASPGATPWRKTLVYLGRVHPKKGCDVLLKALAQIPPSDRPLLAVAGGSDDAYGANLRSIVADRGLDAFVQFLGPVHGNAKWELLERADAFVLPSHQENFGIAIVEALAVGTPVLISTGINIHREIVESGAGLAAAPTLESVHEMMNRFLALPESAIRQMRVRARACFVERYDLEKNIVAFEDLLRSGVKSQHEPT